MTDLRTLMDVATDELKTPDLARTVLTTARRRRNRRRTALASVAAGAAVAGAIAVPRAIERSEPVREPQNTPTPSPEPSTEEIAIAPPIDESVIQPIWDPGSVVGMPTTETYMGLPPEDLDVAIDPDVAAHASASMSIAIGETEIAIGYESGWRSIEAPAAVAGAWISQLSRDGQRIAVSGNGGLWWRDLPRQTGWRSVDVPDAVAGEDVRITWMHTSDRLILSSYRTGYVVDLDGGAVTELPYLGDYASFDVASDGLIVARALEPRSVVEWDVTEPVVSTLSGDLGGLAALVAAEDRIAATRIDITRSRPPAASDYDGLVVLERGGLATQVLLPFSGRSGVWVNGGQVTPVQWLDDHTLLFSVLVPPSAAIDQVPTSEDSARRYLLTWDMETGDLARVWSYDASFDMSLGLLVP